MVVSEESNGDKPGLTTDEYDRENEELHMDDDQYGAEDFGAPAPEYRLRVGSWQRDICGWRYVWEDSMYPHGEAEVVQDDVYRFNDDGYMITGWHNQEGEWEYFASSGAQAFGWPQVGGTWYYLNASGAMVTGTQWIDGARH